MKPRLNLGVGRRVLLLGACICLAAAGVAAKEPENFHHFNRQADGTFSFRNSTGTPINQDYYELRPIEEGPNSRLLTSINRFHVDVAWNDLKQQDWKGVRAQVTYSLQRIPNHPSALLILSAYAKNTGDHLFPIRWFEHALELYPQYGYTHALYGKFLMDINSLDPAISRLETAIRTEPNLGKSHALLATALARKGRMDEAVQLAQKARELGYKGRIPDVPR